MQVGSKVQSQLYSSKGMATVLQLEEVFDGTYAQIIFADGTQITTTLEDLSSTATPLGLLEQGVLDAPEAFLSRWMAHRLEADLTQNTLVSSTNFKVTPLPHQLLTVHFVMQRFHPRCLIADEVGLGKTIEAILVYEEYKLRGLAKRALIIVPSGLVLQWQEELRNKFNEHFVVYNREFIKTLKQSHGAESNVWTFHDRILVSLDSVKPYRISKDLPLKEKERRAWHNQHIFGDISRAAFDLLIIDEAHRLSKKSDGSESQRFKLGRDLSDSIPILLLLTATPHQGDADLFQNLMRLIDPVLFADKKMLSPALVQEVSVRNKKRAVVDFEGNRIFKHRITSIIEIERTSEANEQELELYEWITEYTRQYYTLSESIHNPMIMMLVMLYQRITASSSFAVLATMKRRKAFLQGNNEAIQEILSQEEEEEEALLRQILSKNKTDQESELVFLNHCIQLAESLTNTYADKKFQILIELIEEIRRREQDPVIKIIIFTEFRATQTALIHYLQNFGMASAYINGSLSREERVEQIELFRKERPILISTDAGGEGINLQFCHCMIHFDLPWNPSRLEQRIGRVDRIGQKHNVLIFNFHLKNTIEDRVRQVLESKLELIKEQFGEDKYSDVISLLQEEFSFDRIYLDAIQIKEKENPLLEAQALQIYKRAQEIIESEELLIPFTEAEANPKELLNVECNHLIESCVTHFLASKAIQIKRYKENPDLCFFENPFHALQNEVHTYRNATFFNAHSLDNERVDFINLEHPLVQKIRGHFKVHQESGASTAIRLSIQKFGGIQGYWFNYQLSIQNNLDKKQIFPLSIFMEDEGFCNHRVSQYLNKVYLEDIEAIPEVQINPALESICNASYEAVKLIANDLYSVTKMDWLSELERYQERTQGYYEYKAKILNHIAVENIRESRLKKLQEEQQSEMKRLQRKKLIVPKIELQQVAYVEFV